MRTLPSATLPTYAHPIVPLTCILQNTIQKHKRYTHKHTRGYERRNKQMCRCIQFDVYTYVKHTHQTLTHDTHARVYTHAHTNKHTHTHMYTLVCSDKKIVRESLA